MKGLEEILGIDPQDPETMRSMSLTETDHQFLRRLVGLRRDMGLTQQDVADRLGITQASVAAFERYDNDPKLSTIRRYAQVVGLLIAHRVEVDEGQLRHQSEPGWTGGWEPVDPSHVSPGVAASATPLRVSQR
jgi:DNA-binding XRE family transcriptional regulator